MILKLLKLFNSLFLSVVKVSWISSFRVKLCFPDNNSLKRSNTTVLAFGKLAKINALCPKMADNINPGLNSIIISFNKLLSFSFKLFSISLNNLLYKFWTGILKGNLSFTFLFFISSISFLSNSFSLISGFWFCNCSFSIQPFRYFIKYGKLFISKQLHSSCK